MPMLPDGGSYKGTKPTNARPQTQNYGTGAQGGSNSFLNSYAQNYGNTVNSQLANLQNQYNGQVGMASSVYNNNVAGAQASSQNDLARLREQQFRDVDLARLGLGYQTEYQDAGYNNAMRQAGWDMDSLLAQYEADRGRADQIAGGLREDQAALRQRYDSDIAYIQALGGNVGNEQTFLNRQWDNSIKDITSQFKTGVDAAQLQKGVANRANLSDATARGAIGSFGFGQQERDILAQYQNQYAQLGNAHDTGVRGAQLGLDRGSNDLAMKLRGFQNQADNTKFGYTDAARGINQQLEGQGYNWANQERDFADARNQHQTNIDNIYEDYRYKQGQNDVTSQTIDSVAREYGIRQADVGNALKQAMTSAGLDYNNTIAQLNGMLQSGTANAQANAQNFLAQLLAAA